MSEDPAALRAEGERLIAQGRALLERADNLEADAALSGEGVGQDDVRAAGPVVGHARALAAAGWFTAQALVERSGASPRTVRSTLWRMVRYGQLRCKRQPGWPVQYGPPEA